MDGRRHSVDIPISKALTALRRVRSLRDPSTNSLSKFCALVENVNWDTNSCNGISLQFVNGSQKGGSLDDGQLKHLKEEECAQEFDLHPGLGQSKLISNQNSGRVVNACTTTRTMKVEERDSPRKVHGERHCHDPTHKDLELACVTPSRNHLEDVDSCSATTSILSPMEKVKPTASDLKAHYRKQRRSTGLVYDIASCVGSPMLSGSDTFPEESSQNASLFANEDADAIDRYHSRCKVSCCWARTPKFKKSNPFSEFEDNPLLLGGANEMNRCHIRESGRLYNFDIAPDTGTPRSLSQKFRPKSFLELVGQNVVAESLQGAISRGRIASMYLFHGPRGTGKTSASRIFAAALNCLTLGEHGPCGHCRECTMFYSGQSRDVRELDSMKLNRTDTIRSLVKSASEPPISSRFKVFIIDECQFLHGETWVLFLNSLKDSSRRTIFVMITPDLDKLPRRVLTCSQRYHFHKIKDVDIAGRLGKICAQEGLDFDQAALDFIAAKSSGSLRDAEMMLDQLSLLGKRITVSLAYDFIGTVSDDELLDLLDLALSSDTSNTVIRARELMRSRIDPMQLISQLANLIMDILSGNGQDHSSESRRKFYRKHTSEADLHKLGHALKILSESEKQLRMSKNQTTWLTVALLQLSTGESSPVDENDGTYCSGNGEVKDGDHCGRPSTGGSKKHCIPSSADVNRPCCLRTEEEYRKILDSVWRKATDLCYSNSLKNFLRKQGRLSSLGLSHGLAVAELEFENCNSVSRAEKSWKVIASSLQSVVGCNVEIRINLVPLKNVKVKKPPFKLFSCSRRMDHRTNSISEFGTDSDCSGYASEKPMIGERLNLTCCSDCGSQTLHRCHHQIGASSTLRNGDGNFLSMGNIGSQRSSHDCKQLTELGISTEEVQHHMHQLSSRRYAFCGSEHDNVSMDDGLGENSYALCWRTPKLAPRKTWETGNGKHGSRLMGWVLPCAAVK